MATLRRYVFRGEIRRPEIAKPQTPLPDDAQRLCAYLAEDSNRLGFAFDESATVTRVRALGVEWSQSSTKSVGVLLDEAIAICQRRNIYIAGIRARELGRSSIDDLIQRTLQGQGTPPPSVLDAMAGVALAAQARRGIAVGNRIEVTPVDLQNVDLGEVELGAIARSLAHDLETRGLRNPDAAQRSTAIPMDYPRLPDGRRGYRTLAGTFADTIGVRMDDTWTVDAPRNSWELTSEMCDPTIRVVAQSREASLRGRFDCPRPYSLRANFTQLHAQQCAAEVCNFLANTESNRLFRWNGDNVSHISVTDNIRCWPHIDSPERAVALFRIVVNTLPHHKRVRSFLVNLACVIWYRSAGSPVASDRTIRPLQDAIAAYDRYVGGIVEEGEPHSYPFFRNWGDLRGYVASMVIDLVPRNERSAGRIRRMLDIASERVLAPLYEQDKQAAWDAILERAEHHWASRD